MASEDERGESPQSGEKKVLLSGEGLNFTIRGERFHATYTKKQHLYRTPRESTQMRYYLLSQRVSFTAHTQRQFASGPAVVKLGGEGGI